MKTLAKLVLIFGLIFCGNASAQTDQKSLLGEWVGNITLGENYSLAVVFRCETDKDGKYAAFVDVPDQGAKGIPVSDLVLDGQKLSFKVPAVQGDYTGQLEGDTISGSWAQMGRTNNLNFTRGKYQPAAPQIDLSADDLNLLLGSWRGKVGPLTVVVRFERDAQNKPVVFLDSPDQGAKGIPVAKAALKDSTLTLGVKAVGGEYNGKMSGNTIDGTWTQLGNSMPLTLIKDETAR